MILTKADGTAWRIEDPVAKLALRATLPGARVFDLAAASLRKIKAAGVSNADRLPLALPATWCVNSPAPSTVFRRWALPPQNELWLLLIDVLDEPRTGPLDLESTEAIADGLRALGPEAYGTEAISKVLALLIPEAVPLMPTPARRFVLGDAAAEQAGAFAAMVNWFTAAVDEGKDELTSWANAHEQVPLCAAQVLDRLLWFDSEGHRHFKNPRG
jgi:hypothetical protein